MGIKRIFKLAIISFIILFALVTAMSSLLPSSIIVSRAIDINSSADSLLPYLSNLSKYKRWLAIENIEEGKITRKENREYLQINKTSVNITNATDTLIQTRWQVGEAEPMDGHFRIISHPQTHVKTVQWAFFVKVKWYPWEKFASIISDKTLGTFMEPSLENLKKIAEM